ncbi:hypothetical protein KCP76_02015 [Salmonella enterica subsp. enterica serovar Weltevreden]|nr:hypothetical protein KCP76_02015 [Salmonella enterica subsp. enterica serovar Weltevreden]
MLGGPNPAEVRASVWMQWSPALKTARRSGGRTMRKIPHSRHVVLRTGSYLSSTAGIVSR